MMDTGDKFENEDYLLRYLLGDLPESERAPVEERIFNEDDFHEQLQALENDLRFRYAQDKLSPWERERFEQRFLVTLEDRRRVDFAAALVEKLSQLPATETQQPSPTSYERGAWWSSIFAGLGLSISGLRWAAITAMGLVMIGSGWLARESITLRTRLRQLQAQHGTQVHELQQQMSVARARAEQLSEELVTERAERLKLQQESGKPSDSERRSARPPVFIMALNPGLLRSAGEDSQILHIAPGTEQVRIDLRLRRKTAYPYYRAILKTIDKEDLWSIGRLQPIRKGTRLVIELIGVPAAILPSDDYEISLMGVTPGGQAEFIDKYGFRVIR